MSSETTAAHILTVKLVNWHTSKFTTDLQHVNGNVNQAADALSHISTLSSTEAVTLKQLASTQGADPELKNLLKSTTSSVLAK